MRKTIIEPLDRPFARVVVTEFPDHKRVFMSGMVAVDADGSLVGENDVTEQTRFVLQQIESYLGKAGGTVDDIVRIRVYLNVDLTDENYAAFNEGRSEFFKTEDQYPASTVVKVDGLVDDRYLVEIETEAVIPDDGFDVELVE